MRIFAFVIAFFLSVAPALAQRDISFASSAGGADGVIVGLTDANDLSALDGVLDATGTGNVARAIENAEFKAEAGATLSLVSGADGVGEVHLVGLGTEAMRPRDWADFGGRAAGLAKLSKANRLAVIAPRELAAAEMAKIAQGAALGQDDFLKYKSEPKAVSGNLVVVGANAAAAQTTFDARVRHLADAVLWVRDMQAEPANALYPEEFVRRTRGAFTGVANVSIRVLDVRAMERLGMGALLGVGQGSRRPPRLLIIEYNGGAAGDAPLVYAGKGITFDSGGISLKRNSGMWMMKSDMTGAAAVTGAVMSLAKSQAPVNVVAIAALAENMPGGAAQRPGDVVKTMSGKTVEIMSTDAEGRLVLSDAVWYAQEQFNPALLVDVATLTGSVGRALGDEYAGLFTRDDALAEELLAAGEASGDDLWRLPLHPNHKKQIESFIADIKNGDTGAPGASTGATFIGSFVKEETPWVHLDIAGVDWFDEPTPTTPKGFTGFSVRLLDELARSRAAQ